MPHHPPAGEVVISMRPVGVFANGPGSELGQLQAGLRGRWPGGDADDDSAAAGAWVYRLGRRCATDFIALPDQLLRAFPRAPVIAVICDNDSIHHARKVIACLEEHPRLTLLYGAGRSPHDNPAGRIWAALKNYVANTAVSWPGRLRQIHSFFRARSPGQMLATCRALGQPLAASGYEQNSWNAA